MLITESRIQTARPGRYLTQLCTHVSNISGSAGPSGHARDRHAGAAGERPEAPHAEWSDNYGTITIANCTITIQASPGMLLLHAEADHEPSLQQAQDRITGMLERIGRRDQLTVRWQRADLSAAGG